MDTHPKNFFCLPQQVCAVRAAQPMQPTSLSATTVFIPGAGRLPGCPQAAARWTRRACRCVARTAHTCWSKQQKVFGPILASAITLVGLAGSQAELHSKQDPDMSCNHCASDAMQKTNETARHCNIRPNRTRCVTRIWGSTFTTLCKHRYSADKYSAYRCSASMHRPLFPRPVLTPKSLAWTSLRVHTQPSRPRLNSACMTHCHVCGSLYVSTHTSKRRYPCTYRCPTPTYLPPTHPPAHNTHTLTQHSLTLTLTHTNTHA